MKIREECRGCLYSNANCHIRGMKKVDECPCVLCLVKVTCIYKYECNERRKVLAHTICWHNRLEEVA